MSTTGLLSLSLLLGLLLAGCSAAGPLARPAAGPSPAAAVGGSGAAGREIVVFAAASLTDAFRELGARYEQAHPGTRVVFSFGASSQLRLQLELGARADLFASADQAQLEAARQADVLVGQEIVFARNRLTLVTPSDNRRGLAELQDLAGPGVRLVAAQPNVPIGQYTQALLERASTDPAFGPDFKARVERNVVSREDNVRQVVAKVAIGEADAAIVYSSDLTPVLRSQLRQIAIPDALNQVASYPAAVARGGNPAGGEAFLAYLLEPAAQELLTAWGFLPGREQG